MNSAFIQGALGLSNKGVGRYNYWKYKFGIDGWLGVPCVRETDAQFLYNSVSKQYYVWFCGSPYC